MLAGSLGRNSRIKDLEIELNQSTLSPDFFRSVIAERKTESLKLLVPGNGHNASGDDLAEVLSQSDCCLRELCVEGNLTNWFENTNGPAPDKKNRSVVDLSLNRTRLPIPKLLKVINMFESLVSLDLAGNNLSDLSVLDHLLLREGLSLQSLNLRGNQIDANNLQAFASKMPRMKCLRSLEMQGNPCFNSRMVRVRIFDLDARTRTEIFELVGLEEAFWGNTSLERFTFSSHGMVAFSKKDLALVLNKCGRRQLRKDQPLSAKLWPLVLHRTQTISLVPKKDDCGLPNMNIGPQALKAEALYWLIRERAVHSLGFHL